MRFPLLARVLPSVFPLVLAPLLTAACHDSSNASPTQTTRKVPDAGGTTEPEGGGKPLAGEVDVLTQHNDVSRSGQNLAETKLTTANVDVQTFGKLFDVPVDGLIWSQPLIVSHYDIGGAAHDVLVVATAHNSVYAVDADTGSVLWTAPLGASVPSATIRGGLGTTNIQIEVGILSTPVIDRENGLVYVTNKTYVKETQELWLHALSLATGVDAPGSPVAIKASAPGVGPDGPTTVVLDAPHHAQRPALLLANGNVYIAFASHEDWQPYHGWILGYHYDPASKKLAQTAVLNLSPDGSEAGIWMSGQGLISDGKSIYALSANGSVTMQSGGNSYGESFLRMTPALKIEDYFTPSGYGILNRGDIDLGAAGAVLIPGTTPPLLVGGGKQGILYLVDSSNMGHLSTGADKNLEEFPATNSIYGAPVVWMGTGSPRLYLWGVGDALKVFTFAKGEFATTPAATSGSVVNITAPGQDPVGNLSVSSNGGKPGTGIVWASNPTAGPDHATVPGTLYAFDAMTLKVLWNSKQNASRDDFGNYAKFIPPTIANGKVYVATGSKQVSVYGLLDGNGK